MTTETKRSMPVIIVAIVAVAVLEAIALIQGINGILLASVIGVIAALAGVKIGKVWECRCQAKKNKEVGGIPPSTPSEGEPRR